MTANSPLVEDYDKDIICTADHAILTKLSCIEKGYYDDPFVRLIAHGAVSSMDTKSTSCTNRGYRNTPTHEPIIRKGTHARVIAIDRAINSFLSLRLHSTSELASGSPSEGLKATEGTLSVENENHLHHEQHFMRQVVILGAGRDTTYLRYRFGKMMKHGTKNKLCSPNIENGIDDVRWFEVDHSSVIQKKVTNWLPNCIPAGYSYDFFPVHHSGTENHLEQETSFTVSISKNHSAARNIEKPSSNYHLIGFDLRHAPSKLFDILTHPQHEYDKSLPTLFVLECVTMYLPEVASRDLLKYLAETVLFPVSKFPQPHNDPFVAVVIYDPIPGNDRFGEVMIKNLQDAGLAKSRRTHNDRNRNPSDHRTVLESDDVIPLSFEKTRTLSDQLSKLIASGFDRVVGCNMMDAYNYGVITADDRSRASRSEMLDEVEEFELMMRHYSFSIGVRSIASSSSSKQTDISCEFRDDGKKVKKHHAIDTNPISVGYNLCSIGEHSLLGFHEGHCMVLER